MTDVEAEVARRAFEERLRAAVAEERQKVVAYLRKQCYGHVSNSGTLPEDIENGRHLRG